MYQGPKKIMKLLEFFLKRSLHKVGNGNSGNLFPSIPDSGQQ